MFDEREKIYDQCKNDIAFIVSARDEISVDTRIRKHTRLFKLDVTTLVELEKLGI